LLLFAPSSSDRLLGEKGVTAASWLVSPIAVNDDLPVTLRLVGCAGEVAGVDTGVDVVALLLHAVQIDATAIK
jgi:hypothetical protein